MRIAVRKEAVLLSRVRRKKVGLFLPVLFFVLFCFTVLLRTWKNLKFPLVVLRIYQELSRSENPILEN
jgi:hypothetical protein